MTWRQYGGNFDNPINPEYEQEARLVEQSRAGSERAFSALLARYQQPVFRLILYLVGDEEEARDLTRIAIKNALLHMPSVPAGFSIRPWLLRVAVLVALDAVRDRSESPQELIASLQLPPPPQVPRIVDADPTENDTMVLGLSQFENLAQQPETAIADAWDTLPLDVERELIRRLLAGLPEGDAELLALGVVGQIPTRDLAALAGTSQRSIRRRIARALILFQSHYHGVRTNALPPAPETKELPQRTSATITAPLVDAARRGLTEANNLVKRGIAGVRMGFGSVDAQERLQTLRTGNVPAAGVVPTTPNFNDFGGRPDDDLVTSPPFIEAQPTRPTPPMRPREEEATQHLAAKLPEADMVAQGDSSNSGTFDPQSFSAWTVPVSSMEMPDLGTTAMPVVTPPEPDTIHLPGATLPATNAPEAVATETRVPAPEIQSEVEDVAAAASGMITIPAMAQPDTTTLARPTAPPDVQIGTTTPSRKLPRFGPPPEEVLVGMPANIDPFATSVPAMAEDAVPESMAETTPEPVPETAALDETEPEQTGEASDLFTIPATGDVAALPTVVMPPDEAPPEATRAEPALPEEAASEAQFTVPSMPEEAIASTIMMMPSAADEATASPAAPDTPTNEAPAEEAASNDVPSVPSPNDDGWTTLEDALAAEPEVATFGMSGTWAEAAAAPSSEGSSDDVPPAHEPVATAPTAVPEQPEIPAEVAPQVEQPSMEVSAPAEAATQGDEQPAPESAASETPPPVTAIERDITAIAPAFKRDRGSTVVLQPMARQEYVSRHRPAWLDAGDMGSIPGVALNLPPEEAEQLPEPAPPSVPLMGALTLPTTTASATDLPPTPDEDPIPQPATPAEDTPMDQADLSDLTGPPPEPASAAASEAPVEPATAPPPVPRRLRPPTRPMPRLERDTFDQPRDH